MLTSQQNDILCKVGPDAPMGQVLRRYWTPAFLLSDLPGPDCPPIGVTVLGEDFVAFRDSSGRLGFLDELCCHRGAPLSYGRVEEGGIRCLYHGWKYDTEGRILEAPNCENPFVLERVRQGSYPVREAGGLGWVYLGPREEEPPFPHFPWMDHPAEEFSVSEAVLDCNWVQIQEGSLDSSHLGLLHLDTVVGMRPGPRWVGSLYFDGVPWEEGGYGDSVLSGDGMPTKDNAPAIHVADTPFGFQYAAVRRMDDDPARKYVRITALAFPYAAHIGGSAGAVIVVPRDDETCSFIGAFGGGRTRVRRPPAEPTPAQAEVREIRYPQDARYYRVPPQNRAAMAARRSFAGFPGGNRPQDSAVQGANAKRRTYTRATEHLVPADAACLRFRRLLLESLERVEAGQQPLGLGEGYDFRAIQGYSGAADVDAGWEDLVPGNACQGPLPIRQGASARV
jgi:nitrite reductase/ring-hydroxylating ferredoxin subunit